MGNGRPMEVRWSQKERCRESPIAGDLGHAKHGNAHKSPSTEAGNS